MQGGHAMHAKVVHFQIKPGRKDEVIRLFGEFIVPGAEKQKGFKAGMLLTDPDTDKAMSIALWETAADIKASEAGGYYQEWVAKLSDALASPPARDLYEVSNMVNLSIK
jgi:quinol monooxygenase YgiN